MSDAYCLIALRVASSIFENAAPTFTLSARSSSSRMTQVASTQPRLSGP